MQASKFLKYLVPVAGIPIIGMVLASQTIHVSNEASYDLFEEPIVSALQPMETDSPVTLPYPFEDRITDPISNPPPSSGLYLNDPGNISTTVEYDPNTNEYNIQEGVGNLFFRDPTYMTFREYVDSEFSKSTKNYWKQRAAEDDLINKKNSLIPKLYVNSEAFDRIFGGNVIDIRPQGSAELTFGLNVSKNENPGIPEKQRKVTTFDFRERIQLNVIGNIGEKLKMNINYNTEASFDFENQIKMDYTGNEDDIIQKIEAGNVTLPLTGTLIQGSQSLFGIKGAFKFGRLTLTGVLSQEKGQTSNITISNGAQTNEFEIQADQYESNKHFFLSQYFKDRYDQALSTLPIINSNTNISKIEVWVTNRTSVVDNTRNIIAYMDLGESTYFNSTGLVTPGSVGPFPDNNSNTLYNTMNTTYNQVRDFNDPAGTSALQTLGSSFDFKLSRDYEKLENARLLNTNEYTFHPTLGYLSLNFALNANEVLAVAYEYTVNGQVYRVGDLTTNGFNPPNALYLKLLKSTNVSTKLTTTSGDVENPLWDLMMKNIYNLNAYQVSREGFKLDVIYSDDATGTFINYLPVPVSETTVNGKPLINVLNLDKLNAQNDPQPDGVFDFVDNITINTNNGRVIFPVREPFGSFLRTRFVDPVQANKYVFEELYDSTRTAAQQLPEKNKYFLKGSYQSSVSSDISLNAINIPQGAVKVTAGGIPLVENVDFQVDYNLGRVKIINQSVLNSGMPLNISVESQSLFSIQTKTLYGLHMDYEVNKNLVFGSSILHLHERPLTQKINIGDEPISNWIAGVDGTWRTESRFLTKMIDKLPLIQTKERSDITVTGEYARLFPGNARAIGKKGTAYIDDFEGSRSTIDLKNPGTWSIASTPQGQPNLFPEGSVVNDPSFGYGRAKLAWYYIDPSVFYRDNNVQPAGITDDMLSDNSVREVLETEIFPFKQSPNGQATTLPTMNLSYYPKERGPYNYDVNNIDANGNLLNPQNRWGGIQRRIETSDFESANIEFIQFWMMDPYNSDNPLQSNNGELYFNLGNISEDVLNDGKKSFENGLPTNTVSNPTINTPWGVIPTIQSVVNAFDNDPASRTQQDVGLDGLIDADERVFFKTQFLDSIAALYGTSSQAYLKANADPSSDNFLYFRDGVFDSPEAGILNRYKKYNGQEGNSPVSSGTFTASATNIPDNEDINRDNTLNTTESYYQYKVLINKNNLNVGQNFITDKVTATVRTKNGDVKTVDWYQFKIPVNNPQTNVNNIEDFKSIQFVRMFLKGFNDSIIVRFANLELLRGEWRKYVYDIRSPGEYIPTDPNVQFDVSYVNLEENGNRQPINYILPPGIDREINVASTNLQELNEQSMSLKVCNLEDGDARAAYKNLEFDFRNYKKLKMYIHAEDGDDGLDLKKNDVTVFIRLGTDFTSNYYEYEIPVTPTAWGNNSDFQVWPEDNFLEISLDELTRAKQIRNSRVESGVPGASYNSPYSAVVTSAYTISINGYPNLGNVRTVMVGIRNPKDQYANDDHLPKCVEVWVNELRMTDFDNSGGWAANARVSAKLASLGNLTLSGSRSSYGYGGLEKKLNERSLDEISQFDLATTLQLGEFVPKNVGLSLPMYIGYSTIIKRPKYDPLNPDIEFQTALDNAETKSEKKEIRRRAEDVVERRGINFTNVRKNKVKGGKPHFYSIENFNLTYAYSELFKRNINTEFDILRTTKYALGYNFNNQPKSWSPFSKSKSLSSKYVRFIKDFNLYTGPSAINFRTDLDRVYGESLIRNNASFNALINPTYNKSFQWTRQFDIRYDLTKALKFDFNSRNLARIDEPEGKIDTEEKRDSVKTNLKKLGRNIDYRHAGNISYNVPLNKFPLVDWINVNGKYGFDYSWVSAPLVYDSVQGGFVRSGIGNTIQNSNTKQVSANITFASLYNKFGIYKKLQKPRQQTPKRPPPKAEPPKNANDTIKGKKKKEKKEGELSPFARAALRALFSLKSFNLTYSQTNGTMLPGFVPYAQLSGYNFDLNAPGFAFVAGSQADLRGKAARNKWLSNDTLFNGQYQNSLLENLTARLTIEPVQGFRIELNATRNFANNISENFDVSDEGLYTPSGRIESGNFSVSYITWATAFKKDKDYVSDVFKQFDEYRIIISERLAQANANSVGFDTSGFYDGYGPSSQEVLTYAFLAAYSGADPKKVKTDPFPSIPLPNWRITFDGFMKIPWFRNKFQSMSISHSYRSTYNVNSYSYNLSYLNDQSARDANNNFIPRYELTQVSISEQFSPLLGVDMTWKNNLSTRFEYKRDRNLALSYTNIQLTETKGNEIVVGLGYRFKKFVFPFKIGGKRPNFNNNLNLTGDFAYRRNATIIRKMQEGTNQPTGGMDVITMKFAADYMVNERFNVKLFFDRIINEPVISTAFPTANTSAGVSIRFTLAQ
ncbi:MAG TPA: cell surface protein SprA [Bacteroidia bacterium]|nr:cell surface protein SprA [Bacteroidia bacterium]HNT79091.1 cell surface protein SprA [Bacteroidia bacterium]